MKKGVTFFVFICLLVFGVSACGRENVSDPSEGKKKIRIQFTDETTPLIYNITYIDTRENIASYKVKDSNVSELLECIDRATLLIKEGDKKPLIIDIRDESMEFKIKSQVGSMDLLQVLFYSARQHKEFSLP